MKIKILALEDFIVSIPQKCKTYIADLIKYIHEAIDKLTNLSQTNYDLGVFHINKGNMRDAKMRFIFVIKLKPDMALAHYHLARCHLFNLEFDKAKSELETSLTLDPHLSCAKYRLDVLENDIHNTPIPIEIIREDYDNFASKYEDYLEKKLKYTAPEKLSTMLCKYIKDSQLESQGMFALDLGCGTGLVGIYLRQLVAIKSLTGIDISKNMIDLAEELELNNQPLYTETQNIDFNDLKITKRKYSIIVAALSLVFDSNLTKIFEKLNAVTADDAILGVVFPKSESSEVYFNYDTGYYHFTAEYLMKIFDKYKWKVADKQEIALFENGTSGFIFILSK